MSRLEENAKADEVHLTPDQVARLNLLEPAVGDRYGQGDMATIDV